MLKSVFARTALAAALTAGAFAAVTLAAPSNGGFEDKSFKGWERVNDGPGHWEIYKGKFTPPDLGLPRRGPEPEDPTLPKPPQGKFAAADWQEEPSLNILHRVMRADKNGSMLSLKLAYDNTAEAFATPDSFETAGEPNQQIRIDLLERDAPLETLDPGEIIDTMYQSEVGDEPKRGYFKISDEDVDEGRFRLRIAEVDNQAPLLVGVDAVKLKGP
jgi:hypothetical protein